VTCLDVDRRKIEKLKKGICPIYEPGLTELMEHNIEAGRLTVHPRQGRGLSRREMIFICVGTPTARTATPT
jgi:UDPglucose 6-dehydrogenase